MTNHPHLAMTETSPITPPKELVSKWLSLACDEEGWASWDSLATQAAQWGADQQLEAFVKWIEDCGYHPSVLEDLRAAMRPKPPSDKELALARTYAILNDPNRALLVEVRETLELNCRALEQLPDAL